MGERGPISGEPRVYDPAPFTAAPPLGRRPGGGSWPAATTAWWKAVSTMPHCVDWEPGDWESARMTALIHARVVEGDVTRSGELRLRERLMGATGEGRARLGIKYEESTVKPSRKRRDLRLVDDALEA